MCASNFTVIQHWRITTVSTTNASCSRTMIFRQSQLLKALNLSSIQYNQLDHATTFALLTCYVSAVSNEYRLVHSMEWGATFRKALRYPKPRKIIRVTPEKAPESWTCSKKWGYDIWCMIHDDMMYDMMYDVWYMMYDMIEPTNCGVANPHPGRSDQIFVFVNQTPSLSKPTSRLF